MNAPLIHLMNVAKLHCVKLAKTILRKLFYNSEICVTKKNAYRYFEIISYIC